MDISYIVIPLIVLAGAATGSYFTSRDLEIWYSIIKKPAWTPPGWMFGIVWTPIYVLGAISALDVWTATPRGAVFWITMFMFLANIVLNAAWTYIFFRKHNFKWGFYESVILDATIVALLLLTWPVSPFAAYCLVPYFVWVSFATVLAHRVWVLNRQ